VSDNYNLLQLTFIQPLQITCSHKIEAFSVVKSLLLKLPDLTEQAFLCETCMENHVDEQKYKSNAHDNRYSRFA
jgi:hypothetical protein